MIVIVDYGMGNLRSVLNALEALGAQAQISSDPAALTAAERIVLPGVGAFGEAMHRLRERGLVEALTREVGQGKPILGLCLGMQLLAERGLEHGEHAGLGWIAGEVRRLEPPDPALRVPHIGWNEVTTRPPSRLLAGIPDGSTFYFVHSYHLLPRDQTCVTGTCDYGGPLVAVVEQGHVMGTQFHPEKSQKAGLQLLRNFLALPRG
jgi:glutamine amidotransferase